MSFNIKYSMCDLICDVNYWARLGTLRYELIRVTDVSTPFLHQFALASYEKKSTSQGGPKKLAHFLYAL